MKQPEISHYIIKVFQNMLEGFPSNLSVGEEIIEEDMFELNYVTRQFFVRT